MAKRRGRPQKDGARTNTVTVKLSDQELANLEERAGDLGLSRSAFIRYKLSENSFSDRLLRLLGRFLTGAK